MTRPALLVTGIHREELAFGDRVSALLDREHIDLLRIPNGIPRARRSPGQRFYSNAQHREIYLQLRQQVRDHYRLMVDLHCGFDERGLCADLFCHDEDLLTCIGTRLSDLVAEHRVRLIRIVSDRGAGSANVGASVAEADARTWIPSKIWLDAQPLYVGLEIYLPTGGAGEPSDWAFACRLIEEIQDCTSH